MVQQRLWDALIPAANRAAKVSVWLDNHPAMGTWPSTLSVDDYVEYVLQLCDTAGLSGDPPLIVGLLMHFQQFAGIPELIERFQRLAEARDSATAADPFESQLLFREQPFLDRRPTRKLLRELAKPGGLGVAVIRGPEKSGKSYTFDLIQHICFHLDRTAGQGFALAHCEYVESSDPHQALESTASTLGGKLGLDPESIPPRTELTKWAGELARWLVLGAVQTGRSTWLVLDGYDAIDDHIEVGTDLLIQNLVRQIRGLSPAQHVRLVLLGYHKALDRRMRYIFDEDEVSSDCPGEEEVRQFLHWFLADRLPDQAEDERLQAVEVLTARVLTDSVAKYGDYDPLTARTFALEDVIHAP